MMQKYHPVSGIIQNLTQGNKYKLLNDMFDCFTWKYSVFACIVNIWNKWSNSVVDADTVCLSNASLGKFWLHQDVKYDFTADLISDRSVNEMHWL